MNLVKQYILSLLLGWRKRGRGCTMTSVCLNSGGHPNLQFTTVWHLLHCLHVCYVYPRTEEYNIIQKYEKKNIGHFSQETGYLEVSWMAIFQQPFFLTFIYFHCWSLTHVMFFLGYSHGSTNSEHSLVPINEGKKSEVGKLMSHGFAGYTCWKWWKKPWLPRPWRECLAFLPSLPSPHNNSPVGALTLSELHAWRKPAAVFYYHNYHVRVSEWVWRVLQAEDCSTLRRRNSVEFTRASPSAAAFLALWKGFVPTEGFGKRSSPIKQKREEGFCLQSLQLEMLKCTAIRGVGRALASPSWKRGDDLLTSIMPGIQKQSRIGLSDLRYIQKMCFSG